MGSTSSPALLQYSMGLDRSLAQHLDINLREGLIGPTNAERLLGCLPTATILEDPSLEARLQEVRDCPIEEETEVIAPALRTASDFNTGQLVRLRSGMSNTTWLSGAVMSRENDLVAMRLEEDELVSLCVPPFHCGFYSREDYQALEEATPGSGHVSLVHFVVRLSFFDERTDETKLIEKVIRSFRHR